VEPEPEDRWYAVRSLFQIIDEAGTAYEERITLWQAGSSEQAVENARAEAEQYAEFAGLTYLTGFAQAYPLADSPPRDGAEVFSLIRDSALPPKPYLDRFFSTGQERNL
jgi:hypothetical protein